MPTTELLIIGGGLSGLALADYLHRGGTDYLLVEARARLGGRIKVLDTALGRVDLGPSWFWPGQPRMAAAIKRFGLTAFEQYAQGALSYENAQGEVLRNQGWSSMQGALRLEGGMARLIDGYEGVLSTENLLLNKAVTRLVRSGGKIEAFDDAGALIARANKVALAIPPRIAARIHFEPALPDTAVLAMQSVPTWMAGHAKFVALYETPFWRDLGLSGDAMSQYGPMVEMHDASDPRAGSGALFGFLGVPADVRERQRDEVIQACIAQLARIFGDDARSPLKVHLQDWVFEPETAVEADRTPPAGHPHYGMPAALLDLWDGTLLFSSTEVAPQFGGFLEGALEAADHAAQHFSVAPSSNSG